MSTDDSKAVEVCRKLLDLLEKEQLDIEKSDLDGIERNCLLKMELLKELDEINKAEPASPNKNRKAAIEPLLKKIVDLNEVNTEAVRNLKKDVLNEITSGHKKRGAFKAYNS